MFREKCQVIPCLSHQTGPAFTRTEKVSTPTGCADKKNSIAGAGLQKETSLPPLGNPIKTTLNPANMKVIGQTPSAVSRIVSAIQNFRFNFDRVGMKGSYRNDPIWINTLHAPIYRAIGYVIYYRGFSISVDFELCEITIVEHN